MQSDQTMINHLLNYWLKLGKEIEMDEIVHLLREAAFKLHQQKKKHYVISTNLYGIHAGMMSKRTLSFMLDFIADMIEVESEKGN